jgi:hypothetical protein
MPALNTAEWLMAETSNDVPAEVNNADRRRHRAD